jgi:hypothetical protein
MMDKNKIKEIDIKNQRIILRKVLIMNLIAGFIKNTYQISSSTVVLNTQSLRIRGSLKIISRIFIMKENVNSNPSNFLNTTLN